MPAHQHDTCEEGQHTSKQFHDIKLTDVLSVTGQHRSMPHVRQHTSKQLNGRAAHQHDTQEASTSS
eukprot:362858-Chlamydomonas_euryale.AAC.5